MLLKSKTKKQMEQTGEKSKIKTLWQIINFSYNQVVNKSSALVYK